MEIFKKISKVLGFIISIWIIWAFSLFLLIDKTQPYWVDTGWLEILIMNIGLTVGSVEVLIFGLINYSIVVFLAKKIINIRNITMFFLVYILTLIMSFSFKAFFLVKLDISIYTDQNILSFLFLPLIFNILIFNFLKFHKNVPN